MRKMKGESLHAGRNEDYVSLALDGRVIAVYHPSIPDLPGEVVDMEREYGFRGFLGLDTGFFHKFRIPPHQNSRSHMQNVAKAFFDYGGQNHACLVQYLHPDGSSREHYHTLDEHIACLAGKSFLVTRSVDDDSMKCIVPLTPGEIVRIPPNTSHIVATDGAGSITVPIKPTIKGKKDHLYMGKSPGRLGAETDELILMYGSSPTNGVCAAIGNYYGSLTGAEQVIFRKMARERLAQENNPGVKRALEEIASSRSRA